MQTEFQQINESQCITTILDADNVNHIVVFLTGAIPFPEGTGGQGILVYCHNNLYVEAT